MNRLWNDTKVSTRRGAVAMIATGATISILVISMSFVGPSGAVSSHSAHGVEVSTKSSTSLGTYLVSSGRSLYTLNKTSCPSKCLKYWPPLLLAKGQTKALPGAGISASKLARVRDSAGAWQVTYGGKALYWFAKDTKAEPTSGNQVKDTWGVWAIIVTKKPVHTSTTTTTTTVPSGGGTSF